MAEEKLMSMTPQQRAADRRLGAGRAPTSPVPLAPLTAGNGRPCESEDREGHDRHTMRNPTTESDVTAWQDRFDRRDPRVRRPVYPVDLPEHQPWGTPTEGGAIEVYRGVEHYELGIDPLH